MRKASEDERKALEEMLLVVERDVFALKTRVSYLDGLLAELHRQTNGERFEVRNPVVWQFFWDAYGMLVIDLASFTKGLIKAGGFFNRLGNHLVQLRVGAQKSVSARPRAHFGPGTDADRARIDRELNAMLDKRLKQGTREAITRLFPGVHPGKHPTRGDLQTLKDRLATEAEDLLKERDSMTAHRFETDTRAPLSGNIEKLKKHFAIIELILSDIRLIAFGGQYAFDPLLSQTHPVYRDLVDLLLVGSINYVVAAVGMNRRSDAKLRFYYQFRDRLGRLVPPWAKNRNRSAANSMRRTNPQ